MIILISKDAEKAGKTPLGDEERLLCAGFESYGIADKTTRSLLLSPHSCGRVCILIVVGISAKAIDTVKSLQQISTVPL